MTIYENRMQDLRGMFEIFSAVQFLCSLATICLKMEWLRTNIANKEIMTLI